MTNTPTISIVVPTMNRMASLRRFLESVIPQAMQHHAEIVVVSDGSTDGTNDMLGAYDTDCDLTILIQDNAGPAAARNAGVAAASGDLIVFLDDDVVAQPNLLARHLGHHANNEALAVIGPMRTPAAELSPWTRWEQRLLEEQYSAMASGELTPGWREFYTGNASLRRADFQGTGGFDTSYRRGEDVELALRLQQAGIAFAFDPDAEVLHYPERSRASWVSNAEHGGRETVRMTGTDAADLVASEYHDRHPAMKGMLGLLAGRSIAPAMQQVFLRCGLGAHAVGVDRVGHLGLSAAYNLGYFNAAAGALGGRETFQNLMASAESQESR